MPSSPVKEYQPPRNIGRLAVLDGLDGQADPVRDRSGRPTRTSPGRRSSERAGRAWRRRR
ncbi:MAG: hypothetical protein MZV64_34160 [Ignavibacteriales bacterium]|nr:hypothetical protein [Ignavibacteriales bacterium]